MFDNQLANDHYLDPLNQENRVKYDDIDTKNIDIYSEEPLTTPFENIALAFSGGGFRAAAFALGSLSYLQHLSFRDHTNENKETPLLKKVTYISSASGGTITSILYTLHSSNTQSFCFNNFFIKLYHFLSKSDILIQALKYLNDDNIWKTRPDKNRNLINAFALVYDGDLLYQGKTIKDLGNSHPHLQEVCFNSTEFCKGLSFRQNVKLQQDPLTDKYFFYGNYFINISQTAAEKIKLADILAASSCFPAGFEPMIFPNDFTYPGITKDQLLEGSTISETFALMDGGIADNQGLNSLMLADLRRLQKQTTFTRFDLSLITDVGSHYMDAYKIPSFTKNKILNYLNLRLVHKILIIVCIISIAILSFIYITPLPNRNLQFVLISVLTFLGGNSVFLLILYYYIKRILFKSSPKGNVNVEALSLTSNFPSEVINLLANYLNVTKLGILLHMLKNRMQSVIILNIDIFLKRIRQILYERFYQAPVWKNRRKSNHIYDLAITNQSNRQRQINQSNYSTQEKNILTPTQDIEKIAEDAFSMGTTLWFDQESLPKRDKIIITGQFTTCYNLLKYIIGLKKTSTYQNLSPEYRNRVDELYKKLLGDWDIFKQDPSFLFKKCVEDQF
ncbi:patatin-like phospholipase family protein [Cytophagaceae bacterium YF14B1]|uniref:Patatin-like phospholipase family protein n=1 Tax=Xanthocytophaga flava TaxID=3048013 RepID=A0AAE3QLK4_9BACT|nr:patatin-like phospholipase family protein [Xanthocytophaga flavus]MDJ1478853.1 patatin-like phospholipase family protein [Xanthocytophaga flavus]